jgi:hypothetical protein
MGRERERRARSPALGGNTTALPWSVARSSPELGAQALRSMVFQIESTERKRRRW